MAAKRVTLLAIVCLVGLSSAAVPNLRILDGEDTASGDFPHVVSVRVGNSHVCGGTIITQRHVVTAGHCVSELASTALPVSQVSVRSGSINQYAGGQINDVLAIRIHPSYGNFMHDLAIITLAKPLTLDDRTQVVALAAADDTLESEAEVQVTGWGVHHSTASPYKLQKTAMHVLSRPECELEAGYGYESALCLTHAENDGICRGDEGAGVLLDKVLVGVASFAFGNCGTVYPDVAGKISYYREWIDSVTAESS